MTNYYITENGMNYKIKDKEMVLEWVKQFLDRGIEPWNLQIQIAEY